MTTSKGRVYTCKKPTAARDYVASVGNTNPTFDDIVFGITHIEEITTAEGPAIMIYGSDKSEDWANPVYTNFLFSTGFALSPKRSAGPQCFKLQDKYYVRGTTGKDRAPATRRKNRKIIAMYLFEVKMRQRPLLD